MGQSFFSCVTVKMAVLETDGFSVFFLPSPNFDCAFNHSIVHFSSTTKYVVLSQDPTQRELCVLLESIYGLYRMAVSLFESLSPSIRRSFHSDLC